MSNSNLESTIVSSSVTPETYERYVRPETGWSASLPTDRQGYFGYSFLAGMLLLVPQVIVDATPNPPGALLFVVFLCAIGCIWVSVLATFKRLLDLRKSRWYAVLMIVPIVSFFFGVYLLFWPGQLYYKEQEAKKRGAYI